MALNFPPQTIGGSKPLDGTTWAAPNGQQWQYDAAIDAWRALGTPSGSGVTYRGPIDLTQDPAAQYSNIVAGDFFVVEVGANPVSSDYPGIAGDEVVKGMEVIFDGTQYAAVGNLVAYATTTVAGKIEIATLEEVKAGTSFKLAVTPITLDQYLDSDYQPKLPTGSDGLFLGHEAGSPKWKALPDGTEQVKGIVQLAKRDEVPEYSNFYSYYSGGGSNPNPATGIVDGKYTFSPSLAVTPFSIARFFDDLAFADYSIVQRLESHFGIGGLPTDENGDIITHPVVTDDDEGFMSPDQKKQLEDNTQAISDINGEIDDINDAIDALPSGNPSGSIAFGYGEPDFRATNGVRNPIMVNCTFVGRGGNDGYVEGTITYTGSETLTTANSVLVPSHYGSASIGGGGSWEIGVFIQRRKSATEWEVVLVGDWEYPPSGQRCSWQIFKGA